MGQSLLIAEHFLANKGLSSDKYNKENISKDIDYLISFASKSEKEFKDLLAWHCTLLESLSIPISDFKILAKYLLEQKEIELSDNSKENFRSIENFNLDSKSFVEDNLSANKIAAFHNNLLSELDQSAIDVNTIESEISHVINFLNLSEEESSDHLFIDFLNWQVQLLASLNIDSYSLLRLLITIKLYSGQKYATQLNKGISYLKGLTGPVTKYDSSISDEELVARISQHHISLFNSFDEYATIAKKDKVSLEVNYLINFLNKANDDANSFTNYIKWQLNLLAALNIDKIAFVRLLTTVKLFVDSSAANIISEGIQFVLSNTALQLDLKEMNTHKELAEVISDFHIKSFADIDDHANEKFRFQIINDAENHLNFLSQAIESDSIILFKEYINWAESTLVSIGIPVITITRFLVTIRLHLNDAKWVKGIEYLDESILGLVKRDPNQALNSESFLHNEDSKKYLKFLLAGDRKRASSFIMELVESGEPLEDIYINIFQDTQYEIGRLWEKNEVTVAQEHFCTATTQMIMSMLYPKLFNSTSINKSVVATCVGSELHEMGIRMVADFLEMKGWDTYYIGANAPTYTILEAVKEHNADLLAISVTLSPHINKAQEIISEIKSELPNIKIMVGGYPFIQDPSLSSKIGADGVAKSANNVHETAYSLVNGK